MKLSDEFLWQLDAACQGMPEVFLPTGYYESIPDRERRVARAVVVCESCPVFDICDEYALIIRPPGGVWAGVDWGSSKSRRRRVRQART